jgi:hypothetical protein
MKMDDASFGKLDFFYPSNTILVFHPVTLESFESDSDNLYLPIDDFLEEDKLQINYMACNRFIQECNDLVPRCNQYRATLVERIIPRFEKFATVDVPCEVTGFYDKGKVNAFVEYLTARLAILKKLVGE